MKRLYFAPVATLLGLAWLGLSDTALAQVTLTVTPQQLTFENVQAGATSAPLTVNVSASSATTVQVVQVTSWLTVSPAVANIGTTPTAFAVRVNAQGLTQGTYQGSFTIALSGSPTPNQVTVNVQATVTGASVLSANPGTLSFTAQAGGPATPSSTTVVITSSGGTLNYTIAANVPWLILSSTTGTTGGAGFAVSANPAGLTPGSYSGAITVQSTTTSDSVQIAVSLTVNANATLSVSPANPPPFLFQIGGPVPAAKFLTVSSSGGQVAFNVSQSPLTNWLVITPLSGAAGTVPATLTLSVNPQGLATGVHTTNLIVTPVNGSPLAPVPISLVVSVNPLLQLSANTLSFTAPFGGSPPAEQTVQITATGTGPAVAFNVASNQTWLTTAVSAGSTPSTLTVRANPSGLTIGEHTGIITVTPANGDPYVLSIRVTFTITDVSELTAAPSVLLFSHQTNQAAPQAQNILLDSIGQPTSFTLTTTTASCGGGWLSAAANQTTTPAVVTVSVIVAGLEPGTCTGTVRASFNAGSSMSTLNIPVTLYVSSSAALRVGLPQGFGLITVQENGAVPQQLMTLTSTDPQTSVQFTVSATSSPQWLFAPGAGTTPQNVTILVLTAGLTPGNYTGSVLIESSGLPGGSFTIPFRLRVLPNITVTVTPNVLTFEQPQGGSPPASKNITLTSSSEGATFTASITSITGGNWLNLSRTSGAASGTVTVSVNQNSLPQNSYQANVRFVFQNSSTAPVNVTVILNVTPPRTLEVSVQSLQFTHQAGGPAPAAQTFTVSTTGQAADFTIGTVSSGWLSVSPTSGTTPREITVTVNPQNLASGNYNGSITVTAAGVTGSPKTIQVTLIVTGPPPPEPVTITNNASNVAGVIAPGEIITIKGAFLGPATPASFSVTAGGTVSATLSGVRVLFDGIAGTPLYVSAPQINVIAPYEIRGRLQTAIVVEYQGTRSAAITVRVGDYAPGIYTLDSTGRGQAAAVNQNGTFNGPGTGGTTPASPGSVIAIYVTGGGQTNPPSLTGTVSPLTTLLRLTAPVTATVGGLPATVEFAGAAPGLVTGVIQINLRPDPSVRGIVPVEISIAGITSPGGPTVAIQ
jgi:uncharacterized protein (TIGR03437 family)